MRVRHTSSINNAHDVAARSSLFSEHLVCFACLEHNRTHGSGLVTISGSISASDHLLCRPTCRPSLHLLRLPLCGHQIVVSAPLVHVSGLFPLFWAFCFLQRKQGSVLSHRRHDSTILLSSRFTIPAMARVV